MTLYIPAAFRIDDADAQLAFIERHAFGTLVSTGPDGLQVSHVPFLARREAGKVVLLGHLARANDHWRGLETAGEVLAIFQGPHAYVSPGWYAQHPSVPTWNYSAAHAQGRASLLDEAELHEVVAALSARYEAGRERPWRLGDQPSGFIESLLGAIVGFRIEVDRIDMKLKLSQNRPAEVPRVIEALERHGEAALAQLMRDHVLDAEA